MTSGTFSVINESDVTRLEAYELNINDATKYLIKASRRPFISDRSWYKIGVPKIVSSTLLYEHQSNRMTNNVGVRIDYPLPILIFLYDKSDKNSNVSHVYS